MDAKQAADIIKSGNVKPSDFQELYAALEGKSEFAEAFNELRKQMLQAYAKGDSIEVNQSGAAARDDVLTVDQSSSKQKEVVRQSQNIEPWKVQARNDILQWAARTKGHEVPEVKASTEGLHAEFKDGTQINFVAENHVSVKTPAAPKAQNFDMVIALAKKNRKKVKLGENMTPEFRSALIEACAKANVQISNLSLEDLDAYMKFLPKKQKELNVVEEKTESKTAAPQVKTSETGADAKGKDAAENARSGKPVVDNGIGRVLSAVAAHAEARENAARQAKDNKGQTSGGQAETENAAHKPAPAAVNRGHSLSHLTPEQLELLHEKGFEVDVYSHVTDKQFAAINAVLAAAGKTTQKDEPYAVRVHHGHSLGGLSDVELEVLHNSGFEVDRFSHVDDATWAQIKQTLNKGKKEADGQPSAPVQKTKTETEEKTNAGRSADAGKTVDAGKTADADKGTTHAVRQPAAVPAQTSSEGKAGGESEAAGNTPGAETNEDKNGSGDNGKDKVVPSGVVVKTDAGKKDAPTAGTAEEQKEAAGEQKGGVSKPVSEKGKKEGDSAAVRKTDGTDAPVQAQPKKKEGFFAGLWSKVKRNAKKAALITAAVVVSFFAGRSCSGNQGENAGGRDDLPENKIENVVLTTPTDSLVTEITPVDTLTTPDYDWVDAPTAWDSSMSITKAQFDNMYKIIHKHSPDGELWGRMYNNANKNAERFGQPDALSFMFKAMRAAAWTNALNGRICETHDARWASNYSGAFGNVVGPMIRVIKCDEAIDDATLAKARIMLNAVDGNGRLNVFTLDELVPGTSRYNDHDAQGLIIGKTRNVMVDINDDCADPQVGFRMGDVIQQRRTVKTKPEPVVIEEQPDTIRRKPDPIIITEPADTIRHKPDPVIITEPADTIRTKPEPVVQPEGRVAVGSRANLSDRPGAEGVNHAANVRENGSDTGLTGGQRAAGRRMADELHKAGRISDEVYARMLDELKNTK